MFTLGRQREKEHATRNLRSDADKQLIERVVDAIHDVLERVAAPDSAEPVLAEAFVVGGSGAWEQTGSWICQLAREHPSLNRLWLQLAPHKSARIRFRVAALLNDMPADTRLNLMSTFLADTSAKVRSKAAGEVYMHPTADMWPLLQSRLAIETDPQVISSIQSALTACSKVAT
jgi:hypothetical protein